MGAAEGAAVDVPVQVHRAFAVIGIPVPGLFQCGGRQHRLEHRAHIVLAEHPVEQRRVLGFDALLHGAGVELRQADAGPHPGGVHLQHQHASLGHVFLGHPFAGALDGLVQGEHHPRGLALLGDELRLTATHKVSLGGGDALDAFQRALAAQHLFKGEFQSADPFPLAVHIPHQMGRHGHREIAAGHRVGVDAQGGKILVHLHQKRLMGIAPAVKQRLLGIGHMVEQLGIAALAGDGQGVILHPVGREIAALAVIEVTPGVVQRQGGDRLGLGGVGKILIACQQEQPAHHYSEGGEERPEQGNDAPCRQKSAPPLLPAAAVCGVPLKAVWARMQKLKQRACATEKPGPAWNSRRARVMLADLGSGA